jgi:hypothetical protein
METDYLGADVAIDAVGAEADGNFLQPVIAAKFKLQGGSPVALNARVAPRQPFRRIIRSTVRRATGMPWRRRCAHIFRLPYRHSGGRLPSASGS